MAQKIKDKAYLETQDKVKAMLIKALKIKAITTEELMAVLYILGQTDTALELETFIDIFSGSFPVLSQYSDEKRSFAKDELVAKVKDIVSKLVHEDPLKATEIAKAALEPGATWEKLKEQFPEIEE